METQPRRGQNSFMRLHSDLVIEVGIILITTYKNKQLWKKKNNLLGKN